MTHRLLGLALLFACFLGMNVSLWGQNAAATHGIWGYLDPATGSFHSIPAPEAQDAAPPALTTFGGKFVANFTITVNSTIGSTVKIGCNLVATLLDAASGNIITETAGNAVVRGTGSTVACSVTLPYSWNLASGSTDKVSLSYTITSPVAISSGAATYPNRASSQSLGSISVPANGTTTTETVAPTI